MRVRVTPEAAGKNTFGQEGVVLKALPHDNILINVGVCKLEVNAQHVTVLNKYDAVVRDEIRNFLGEGYAVRGWVDELAVREALFELTLKLHPTYKKMSALQNGLYARLVNVSKQQQLWKARKRWVMELLCLHVYSS